MFRAHHNTTRLRNARKRSDKCKAQEFLQQDRQTFLGATGGMEVCALIALVL